MFSLTTGTKDWICEGTSIFLGTMNVSRKRIVEIRPLENKNKHSTSREQSGNIWFPLTTGTKDWICEGTSVFLGTMHASLIENVEIRRLKGGSKFRSDGDRRGGWGWNFYVVIVVENFPYLLDYNSNGKDVSMRIAGVSQLQQTSVKFGLYSSTTSVLTTGHLIQTSF